MSNIPNTQDVIDIIDSIIEGSYNPNEYQTSLNKQIVKSKEQMQVNYHWDIISHRRIIGKFIIFGKKIVRKLFKWYIKPIVIQQNAINLNTCRTLELISNYLKTISFEQEQQKQQLVEYSNENQKISRKLEALSCGLEDLSCRLEDLSCLSCRLDELRTRCNALDYQTNSLLCTTEQSINKMESSNHNIDARLRRIERKLNEKDVCDELSQNNQIIKIDKEIQLIDFDYFLFESKYRGTIEDIKKRQEIYIKYFEKCENVLDVGCGRGEFVEQLQNLGIEVLGIDISEDNVAYCQDRRLPVIEADAFEYLNNLRDNSLDGIFCSQVIEHFESNQILAFIKLAYKKIKTNGVIIIETINPQNLIAVSNWFYMDITHVRPVHPETLKFMLETKGFEYKETLYLQPNDEQRLPKLNLQEAELFNDKLQGLNEALFGAQDYAVVATRLD